MESPPGSGQFVYSGKSFNNDWCNKMFTGYVATAYFLAFKVRNPQCWEYRRH